MGLDKRIPAVTRYCVHPADLVAPKIKIGGTKKLDLPLIKKLNPHLIIANREENNQKQIEELAQSTPVWVSDISNLDQALEAIEEIGKMVDRQNKAKVLAEEIAAKFQALTLIEPVRTALYLIWRKPYMAAGCDTFISSMLPYAGYMNIIHQSRYPQLSGEQIAALNPSTILLSSEPYPFQSKHRRELQAISPKSRIELVDGQMFSWYGSRLVHSPAYFKHLRDEGKE